MDFRKLAAIIFATFLMGSPILAADNAVIVTPGSGVTMKSKDVGAGVQAMQPIASDSSGNPIGITLGSGFTTHSSVTTAYAANQLFANNAAGNAAASQITVTGTAGGTGFIEHFILGSTGTNQPPQINVWLFDATPTTAGLVDRSTYLAPYAADIPNLIGEAICANWIKTNDGTGQYFADCTLSNAVMGPLPFKAVSGQTYLLALEQITAAYTPLSGETHTYYVTVKRDN